MSNSLISEGKLTNGQLNYHTQTGNEWSEVITPKNHLFDLHLKEVWRYRDLLFLFVKRDFAAQYRQTILGPLWYIIQPVFTTVLFILVFNKIAKIPTDRLPPLLFYMSSITIWNYFAACLNSTSNTFVANAGIFGKVYFPRLVLPLSTVVSNIIKFGIQFCLLLAMILYYAFAKIYTVHAGWHNLLIPVIVIIMAAIGLGLGIIISSLTTKYRDLGILISFGVQLLMYITPVAYPLSFLEQSKYTNFIRWNPLSPLVEGFRYAVLGQGTFDIYFFYYSTLFTAVALLCGVLLFNKVERSFMDTV
ncbi:MAG TPA: ABC transporter permease [Chitinophagaceae bacterium]